MECLRAAHFSSVGGSPVPATVRAYSNVGKVTNLLQTEQVRRRCGGGAEGVWFN